MSAAKKIKEQKKKPAEKTASTEQPSSINFVPSLRFESFYFLMKSSFWLFIGLLIYTASILSLIFPYLLPQKDYLTYGRMQACAFAIITYGFLIQFLSGSIIHISCKLNNVNITNRFVFYLGFIFWNIGVLIGAIAILLGHNSGFEYFEFPHYSFLMLLVSSLLIAYNILTLNKNGSFHPSKIFGIGFSLSLLTTLTVAYFFIIRFPTTGAGQIIIHNWLKNALLNVCISCGTLGLIFYITFDSNNTDKRYLHLTLITFFGLLIFGGSAGILPSYPVPRWIFELNRTLSLFLIVPTLSLLIFIWLTVQNGRKVSNTELIYNKCLFYSIAGIALYFISHIVEVFTAVSQMVELTTFEHGKNMLILLCSGVAIYFCGSDLILKDSAEYKLSSVLTKLRNLSCICGLVIPSALIIAGFLQGSRLYDYRLPFSAVISTIKSFYYLIVILLLLLLVFLGIYLIKCQIVFFKVLMEKVVNFKKNYLMESDNKNTVNL